MPSIVYTFTLCLDRRKWRERKGRDLEGWRILCLNSTKGRGRILRGEIWKKNVDKFCKGCNPSKSGKIWKENTNLPSFLFHSLLDKQELISFYFSYLPFPSLPSPSLPFFSIQTCYPNIVLRPVWLVVLNGGNENDF